jgi:hypothetical protein
VGTPAGCRIVHEENPGWGDPYKWSHATYVSARIVETAPGVNIIAYDCGFEGTIDGYFLSAALKWAIDHKSEYNIVAVNMSFGSSPEAPEGAAGPFTREECPTGDDWNFQRLRAAGIVPIAGAGNDGGWQQRHGDFSGISSPACSPYVVSVGGTGNGINEDLRNIWTDSDRAPFLDLLAPAWTGTGYEHCAMGTSLSAPTVAAAFAILHAAKPTLSIDEILNLLKTTGSPVYDGASGLTFPLIQINAALSAAGLPVCYSNLPNPILTFKGTEEYVDAYGDNYIRYKLGVSNYSSFPDGLFASAPDLPPCGLNNEPARTWIDIFDGDNNRIYGFCDLPSANWLNEIWFGVLVGETPPNSVYIKITDRRCGTVYVSQILTIN